MGIMAWPWGLSAKRTWTRELRKNASEKETEVSRTDVKKREVVMSR
jgi:hypothetical protein